MSKDDPNEDEVKALYRRIESLRKELQQAHEKLSFHRDRANEDDLLHCFTHGTASAFSGWVCPICVIVGRAEATIERVRGLIRYKVEEGHTYEIPIDWEPHKDGKWIKANELDKALESK